MTDIFDLKDTIKWLFALRNKSSRLGLERIEKLAKLVENPQKNFPSIHVAGTNGKGSLCAMLESIYRSNSYKVGLFTSPHLLKINERIQINRVSISDRDLCLQVKELRKLILENFSSKCYPSFFEFITLIAFKYFSDHSVDIALIETGLGGRLDATNIIKPQLSIITSIGLDHTEILGDNIKSIAKEKAGIIKKNIPVIIGKISNEAEIVIKQIAKEKNAPFYDIKKFSTNNSPCINLKGTYQKSNAQLAVAATQILFKKFPVNCIESLKDVNWPGRWQAIKLETKKIILDSTHNEEACLQLEENLESLKKKESKKPIVIVGILGMNRARSLMPLLCKHARKIYIIVPNQPRACTKEELISVIPQGCTIDIFSSTIKEAFSYNKCNIGTDRDTILVTGSIYLIGEVLTKIKGLPGDPIGQDLI